MPETKFQKHFVEDAHQINAVAAATESIRNSNGTLSLAEMEKKMVCRSAACNAISPEYIVFSPKPLPALPASMPLPLIESGTAFSWQEVLMETGYFDGAHFNHDFDSITGLTPVRII